MAKSVNSLLIGIAVEKGLIASLDDPAEKYVPELKGSGFGEATIRQLLRMSAGVKFEERYDGRDDIARLRRAQMATSAEKPLDVLASFGDRQYAAGEKFVYASAETTVLGYVLARAAKRDIASLTREWLWKPLGAAEPAAWNFGVDGQEWTEGNFNATLRDWGRLGVLLAGDGRRGDTQIVPREYLLDATDAARQPEAFRPGKATPYFGYGYQFWIFPFPKRTFALLGIYGQSMFVQPETKIVMVHLAVNREAKGSDENIERDALWRGVLESLQNSERKVTAEEAIEQKSAKDAK
jgi:CubicO group peptidase (beta-lactamase class C family)